MKPALPPLTEEPDFNAHISGAPRAGCSERRRGRKNHRGNSRREEVRKSRTLADRISDGVSALSEVEMQLDDLWPDYLNHIGHDIYDQSIEIYFTPGTPTDFEITEAVVRQIFEWGFRRGWCNFADGSQQHFWSWDWQAQRNGIFIGARRIVECPRWNGIEPEQSLAKRTVIEIADMYCQQFANRAHVWCGFCGNEINQLSDHVKNCVVKSYCAAKGWY